MTANAESIHTFAASYRGGRHRVRQKFRNDGRMLRPDRVPMSVRSESGLSPGGLTANECDRDMPHRRIGLGAMPMAFAGLDMRDIAHVNLTLFMLRRHHAGARGHD